LRRHRLGEPSGGARAELLDELEVPAPQRRQHRLVHRIRSDDLAERACDLGREAIDFSLERAGLGLQPRGERDLQLRKARLGRRVRAFGAQREPDVGELSLQRRERALPSLEPLDELVGLHLLQRGGHGASEGEHHDEQSDDLHGISFRHRRRPRPRNRVTHRSRARQRLVNHRRPPPRS
jgi:hypothetical protein